MRKDKPVSIVRYESHTVNYKGGSVRTVSKFDLSPLESRKNEHYGGNLLTLILAILFILMIISAVFDTGQDITFTGLLERLQNMRTLDEQGHQIFSMSWVQQFRKDAIITDNWNIDAGLFKLNFNWFRDFINNWFIKPVTVLLFLVGGLINLVMIIVQLTGFVWGF